MPFLSTTIGQIVATFLVSMVPIIELRGAIPIGVGYGLPYWVAVVVSVIGNKIIGTNIDLVIIGTIMPLVPGVAITNAAMDTLNGDYMSGIAKILEAFVKATSTAIGVGLGIGILNLILGGIKL